MKVAISKAVSNKPIVRDSFGILRPPDAVAAQSDQWQFFSARDEFGLVLLLAGGRGHAAS
jgi:hypothetical protein